MQRQNIHFPDPLWAKLVRLKFVTGISIAEHVRRGVEAYVNKLLRGQK